MALELLAGPFNIVDINNSNAPVVTSGGPYAMWVDPIGLLFENSEGLWLAQMDGSATHHSEFYNDISMCLMLKGDTEEERRSGGNWHSFISFASGAHSIHYEFTPVTRCLGQTIAADGPPGVLHSPCARLADRWINLQGNRVEVIPNGSLTRTTERTILGMSGAVSLSWARERSEIWIGMTGGMITRYNTVNKVETVVPFLSIEGTCSGLWYSCKYDVFVSLHNAGSGIWQIKIWSHKVMPSIVYPPWVVSEVDEYMAPAGKVSSVTCLVLGDANEPCENEVVTWSLVSGPGELSPLTSKVDATGHAYTKYYVPLGASGSAEISASVVY